MDVVRELGERPDMMSASWGGGGHGKVDIVRELGEHPDMVSASEGVMEKRT